MYILNGVYYLTTSVAAIKDSKQGICQGHCIYFTTLAAAVHYNKPSVVESRKFEGMFIWGKL